MLVSILSSEHDNAPVQADVPFDELAESLKEHRRCDCTVATCLKKNCPHKSGPAWSATSYRDGKRAKKNVEAITALVLDLDHLPNEDALVKALRNVGGKYRTVVHSSHSHRPDDVCVRVVIDIDRPIKPEEWDRFRHNVVTQLGIPADEGAKDAARLFFLPSAPKDAAVIAESWEGAQLRVDDFLGAAAASAPAAGLTPKEAGPTAAEIFAERPQSGPVDMESLRDTLKHLSDALSRSFIRPVLEGKPLAAEGARDDAIQRAVSIMAFAFPANTPVDAFLELLRPSILSLPGEPPPNASDWMGVTKEKLIRALQDKAASDAKREAANLKLHENLCRRAAKESTPDDPDPTKPYPEKLIDFWARKQDCRDAADFRDHWIITNKGAAWVFVDGKYLRPLPLSDLDLCTGRDLIRIPDVDICHNDKNDRLVWTPAKSLVRVIGSVARVVEASLALQESRYDASTQTFMEAVCPMRPLVPTFNGQIQTWLEMLGGADADLLLDWVATYWDLSRQTCALYLQSAPGAGKTLLAQGLAKLWTRGGPSELYHVLGGFNDTLTNCPFIFADESLPLDKGKHLTTELRKIIGTTTRTLSRKYLPPASLYGAVRLMLAGNNDRMLETGEELSSGDLAAVAGRFLFLDTSGALGEAIRKFLLEVVGPENINREWLDNSGIARHALWLKDNRKVDTNGRFLVEGRQRKFHEQLVTSSGVTSYVSEFITGFLSSKSPTYNNDERCLVGDGEVWIATDLFMSDQMWSHFVPSVAAPPSATRIGRSLATLSEDRWIRTSIKAGQNTRQVVLHRIKANLILSWADKSKLGDIEFIQKRLAEPNQKMRDAVERQQKALEKEGKLAEAATLTLVGRLGS